MRKIDVIVIGAGIGGCVTSTLLSRKGFKVVMISRDAGTSNHLPESWIYNPVCHMGNVKVKEQLRSTFKKQSSCVFSSPNGEQTIEIKVRNLKEEIEPGDLVQVDRTHLDQILLNNALDSGVDFFPKSIIKNFEQSSNAVKLFYESHNCSQELIAPVIVDATGKTALLSQYLELPMEEKKLDQRIAFFSHFELLSETPPEMRIIAIEGGYLFSIPISNNLMSIGCVLAETSVDLSFPPEVHFNNAISISSYLTKMLAGAKQVLPVIPAKNFQRICLKPSAPCYRLVGDAAAFLDPFFSPGIDFAFFSAEQAAISIATNSPQSYTFAIQNWLKIQQASVYQNIEKSHWNAIIRLFADPHLPLQIPLMLTQAFTGVVQDISSFSDGLDLARGSYAATMR